MIVSRKPGAVHKLQEVHARTHPARYSREFPDEATIDLDDEKAVLLAAIEAEEDRGMK